VSQEPLKELGLNVLACQVYQEIIALPMEEYYDASGRIALCMGKGY
jgi:hypothetical protein